MDHPAISSEDMPCSSYSIRTLSTVTSPLVTLRTSKPVQFLELHHTFCPTLIPSETISISLLTPTKNSLSLNIKMFFQFNYYFFVEGFDHNLDTYCTLYCTVLKVLIIISDGRGVASPSWTLNSRNKTCP